MEPTDEPSANGHGLSDYEALQVRRIARWKSTAPSRLSAMIDTATAPVTWAVGHFIPKRVVAKLVTSMESVAHKADSLEEVKRAAGVGDIHELRGRPLQECDRLAAKFSARAERFAVVESTASGFAGPLVHVPQQLIAALRSIMRIAHCYGYALSKPIDRVIVIDILELAMMQDPAERHEVLEKLFAAADARDETIPGEGDLIARTSRNMIAEEVLDLVPVVGTAVGFLFDSTFMHSVDEAARRVFQERWLRHNGRVTSIPPAAAVERRSSLEEFGLALGQLMYTSGAVIGFTVTIPGAIVKNLLGRRRTPLSLGARHGTDNAVADARQFLAGLRSAYEEEFDEAAGEAAAATA